MQAVFRTETCRTGTAPLKAAECLVLRVPNSADSVVCVDRPPPLVRGADLWVHEEATEQHRIHQGASTVCARLSGLRLSAHGLLRSDARRMIVRFEAEGATETTVPLPPALLPPSHPHTHTRPCSALNLILLTLSPFTSP